MRQHHPSSNAEFGAAERDANHQNASASGSPNDGATPTSGTYRVAKRHAPLLAASDGKGVIAGFESTYRSQARFVSHVVRRFGVPTHEVEDAVQEVFLILHRRFNELEQPALIRRWLISVARHVSRNRTRSWCREQRRFCKEQESQAEHVADEAVPAPDEVVAHGEARHLIQQALLRLAPLKREVLVMAEFEGLSAREIARLSQVPLNTVASRLRAARQELCLFLGIRAAD